MGRAGARAAVARGLLLALLALAGCGYRFAAPGAALPGGVRAVAVPMLSNRTAEPSADAALTLALREQLARAGRLAAGVPDAVLEGTLLSVSGAPLLTAGPLPVYRLAGAAQLVLKRGDAVLAQVTVSGSEEFPSGPDVLLTEANRGAALRRLCEGLAREGLERLSAAPE